MKLIIKNITVLAILFLPLLICSDSAKGQDLAGVRIRVDKDSVILKVNSDTISEDSFGNSLIKGAWFILNLEPGVYNFKFDYPGIDSILRTETLVSNQVISIEIYFDTSVAMNGTVTILSDPDSASVIIADSTIKIIDSASFSLPVGQHEIEVFLEGYEPLKYQFDLVPTRSISLLYKLRINKPASVTADDLGYEQQIIKTTKSEETALRMKETYNSMAETFMIIPFGQGMLARIFMGKDSRTTANVLIISGAVLTSGSYLLGKYLSKRKRKQIKAYNEMVLQENTLAKEMNNQIVRTVRETNNTAHEEWERANRNRGKVEVLPSADSK